MTARVRRTIVAGLAAALLATAWSDRACADPEPDTVLLKNGGRLRGSVMEDDPNKGVSIQLLDGTVRRVPRSDVAEVRYAGAAPKMAAPSNMPGPGGAPAAAPPPPSPGPAAGTSPGAPSAYAAAAPSGLSPALSTLPPPVHPGSTHSLRPRWITGLVLWSLTYSVTIGTTAGIVVGGDGKGAAVGEACIPFAGPFVLIADHNNEPSDGEKAALVTSGVVQQVALAMFIAGVSVRVPGGGDVALAPFSTPESRGLSLVGRF
ncbi:MAG TPA: hypothetical protein VHB21_13835 [Minicystis sp.]|nr:hypothetical protein [Minicystis sp.]